MILLFQRKLETLMSGRSKSRRVRRGRSSTGPIDTVPGPPPQLADLVEVDGILTQATDAHITKVYLLIHEIRKFETENFWKRSTFFWSTLVLVFGGYVLALKEENNFKYEISVTIALIACAYTTIFSLSTRGSKFWQDWWEEKAKEYEKFQKFSLFRRDMTEEIGIECRKHFFLLRPRRWSVSKLTMVLSDVTALVWFGLYIKDTVKLYKQGKLDFTFCLGEPHWLALLVFFFPLLVIIYILTAIYQFDPIAFCHQIGSKYIYGRLMKRKNNEPPHTPIEDVPNS